MRVYSKRRPRGLYLITFKNGTRGYYNWHKHYDEYEDKLSWQWLKTFPFANYGQFENIKAWKAAVDEIVPVLTYKKTLDDMDVNKDQYEVYKNYKQKYFETIEKNMVHSHGTQEAEEEDLTLKLFNLWINNKQTQESIDNFVTPMYGYTDIEVEDLGYLLEKAFRGGIDMLQVVTQNEEFENQFSEFMPAKLATES